MPSPLALENSIFWLVLLPEFSLLLPTHFTFEADCCIIFSPFLVFLLPLFVICLVIFLAALTRLSPPQYLIRVPLPLRSMGFDP
jgi:hypothetical protein